MVDTVSKLHFVSWNVRGLNVPAKRQQVKNHILSEKLDYLCLQEMKLSSIDDMIFRQLLGSRIDSQIHILANGTA
jgi:hypothetical protein